MFKEWENVLNISTFALRIPRARLQQLPDILRAVPADQVAAMQRALGVVWERFTYSTISIQEQLRHPAPPSMKHGRVDTRYLSGVDAIDTLMQVLLVKLSQRNQDQAMEPRVRMRRMSDQY